MKYNFIQNAIIVAGVWILPVMLGSTLLDQLMPDVKPEEKRYYTVTMLILQLVLAFLLFEGFERLIGMLNQKVIKGIRMPELINGAILLGVVQSTTQKTLKQRINIIYDDIDRNLEKIGIK